jgi:hypothetical protein
MPNDSGAFRSHPAAFVRTWGLIIGWILLLVVIVGISIQASRRDSTITHNEQVIVQNQLRIIANLHHLCIYHGVQALRLHFPPSPCPYDRGISIVFPDDRPQLGGAQ